MEIERQELLEEHDRQHLMFWRERVFPEEGIGIQWAETRWHIVAREGQFAAGHIGFGEFSIEVESQVLKVIGVGGVVVRPEFQGQAVPAKMFDTLHNDAPKLIQSETFTLFCPERLQTYYQKHGYQPFSGRVHYQQGGEYCLCEKFVFMYRGSMPEVDTIHIPGEPW